MGLIDAASTFRCYAQELWGRLMGIPTLLQHPATKPAFLRRRVGQDCFGQVHLMEVATRSRAVSIRGQGRHLLEAVMGRVLVDGSGAGGSSWMTVRQRSTEAELKARQTSGRES
jgi:hypothetical protein